MKLRKGAIALALLASGALAIAGSGTPALALDSPFGHRDTSMVAEADAKAEVIVLYGANDNSGIDSSIGKIPALGKPPFSSYNSYKLLDRQEHPLKKGEWVNQILPDSNTLNVSLKDITMTKGDNPEKRYIVDANIKKPDGSEFFPNLEVSAKEGEYFFVGGPKFKDGVLVIGIRIE